MKPAPPPTALPTPPQGLLGLEPIGHAFTWRGASEPVRVVILHRRDLSLAAETEIPAMSMFHFVDAWEARKGGGAAASGAAGRGSCAVSVFAPPGVLLRVSR